MRPWQKRELPPPVMNGNLALASDSLGFIQISKPKRPAVFGQECHLRSTDRGFSRTEDHYVCDCYDRWVVPVMVPRRLHPVSNRSIRVVVPVASQSGVGDWNRTSDLRFTKFRESNLRQPNQRLQLSCRGTLRISTPC